MHLKTCSEDLIKGLKPTSFVILYGGEGYISIFRDGGKIFANTADDVVEIVDIEKEDDLEIINAINKGDISWQP